MMTENGAAAPIAPVAVSGGSKSHYGMGENNTIQRGIALVIVLSGLQPSAPMASPSHSLKAAMVSVIIIPRTNTETIGAADPM